MASVASTCAGGPEHAEPSHCHRRLFLLSELNTHYLNMHLRRLRHSIHVRISLHLNLLTTGRNVMLGDGIIWNASSHRAPLAASLSFSPANPASADALAQDILEDETTNLQEQPRTAKWCCAMTFLVGERVSCVIMRSNPLVNQESHCTASFHGVHGCSLNLLVCTHKNGENKTNPKEGWQTENDNRSVCEGAIQVGDASKVGSHWPPSTSTKRFILGCHHTKVCHKNI